MKPAQAIKTFTERYPFVGPSFWIASIQYFVAQVVVAMAWAFPYSIFNNTISDLGNTVCGQYGGRYVCSPLHNLMNISFVTLGITMIVGGILIYQEFKETEGSLIGFNAMIVSGIGTIMVGLFPENTISALHIFGAFLPFLIGNIGLLILGLVLDIPKWLTYFTLVLGVISLTALVLFSFHSYVGLGIGGMERVVVYPQTVWFTVFGIYISHSHMRSATK